MGFFYLYSMIINQQLKNLIPPLTAEEYNNLEESIKQDGCRDALILWQDTLIDGHNRYEICTRYGVEFKTIQKEFEDIEQVKDWMDFNQLSRRNLTPDQRQIMLIFPSALLTLKPDSKPSANKFRILNKTKAALNRNQIELL